MTICLMEEKDWKESAGGLLFVGWIEGHLRRGVTSSPCCNRAHCQPRRIYHALGVGMAINAQETLGRYYIMIEREI